MFVTTCAKKELMMIRPATLNDLPEIRQCAREAYSHYIDRIGKEPAPMIADFENQIRGEIVYVAVSDTDEVQGFIVYYVRNDHMHLENVAVACEHQGKGIGKTLVSHCESVARQKGLSAVELYTNEMMTENLRLYPRLGYQEIDRRSEDGFNRVYFRKQLS